MLPDVSDYTGAYLISVYLFRHRTYLPCQNCAGAAPGLSGFGAAAYGRSIFRKGGDADVPTAGNEKTAVLLWSAGQVATPPHAYIFFISLFYRNFRK